MCWSLKSLFCLLLGSGIFLNACGSSDPRTITQKLTSKEQFNVEFEDISDTFDQCLIDFYEDEEGEELVPSPSASPSPEEEDLYVEDRWDWEEDNFSISFQNQKVVLTGFGETFYEGIWKEIGPNLIEVTVDETPFVLELISSENDRVRFRLAKHELNEKCNLDENSTSLENQSKGVFQKIINGTLLSQVEKTGDVAIRMPNGICSGTLLRNQWVLTAKHCVEAPVNDLSVELRARTGIVWQSAIPDDVKKHRSLDIALLHLSTPLSINKKTTGFYRQFFLYEGKKLMERSLECYGHGYNDEDRTSLGMPHYGVFSPILADNNEAILPQNESGQRLWYGDSGGSCRSYGRVAGVHKEGQDLLKLLREITAPAFRDWALDQIGDAMTGPTVAAGEGWVKVYEIGSNNQTYEIARKQQDWGKWDEINAGGSLPLKADPIAIGSKKGEVEVYAWSKNFIYRNLFKENQSLSGSWAWTGWSRITSDGTVNSTPAVVKNGYGKTYLFARRSTDGGIWFKTKLTNASSWSAWESLGGTFKSAPAATVQRGEDLYVFAVDAKTNDLLYNVYKEEEWSGWESTEASGNNKYFNSSPSAVVDAKGRLYVFIRDDQFKLWSRRLDEKGWGEWIPLNAPFQAASAPGAVITPHDTLELYVRDFNGKIQRGGPTDPDHWRWFGPID